jgi:hypothetical protein
MRGSDGENAGESDGDPGVEVGPEADCGGAGAPVKTMAMLASGSTAFSIAEGGLMKSPNASSAIASGVEIAVQDSAGGEAIEGEKIAGEGIGVAGAAGEVAEEVAKGGSNCCRAYAADVTASERETPAHR